MHAIFLLIHKRILNYFVLCFIPELASWTTSVVFAEIKFL